MQKTIPEYFHSSFESYLTALLNIGMFLPYFFSVKALLRTLFSPWKNLRQLKTERGFSFHEWADRFGFNLVSRSMGFILRSSIILAFLVVMICYVLLMPLLFIGYFVFLPVVFLFTLNTPSETEKKAQRKQQFIARHLINKDYYQEVESWFERLYVEYFSHREWWKMENLFANPPLARDWAMGYTPALDEYTVEMTNGAYQQAIHSIVGRQKEIEQLERILSKQEEANVLLIGEDGVGRHAVLDALSSRIYTGKTNPLLMYRRILKVNMERILTEYLDQNQRETFFESLLTEAVAARNVILVFDNIEKYLTTGEGHVDMTLSFERFSRAGVQIIGITSPFLYEKYLRSNEKINRAFSTVEVTEVDDEEALKILLGTVPLFEQRFNVTIPYDTVKQTIEKTAFFISGTPFPEKALQALDNACVYTTQKLHETVVKPSAIDITLTERTHVPTRLTQNLKEKLLTVETLMKTRIISQHTAITEVASGLRRSFLLLGKRRKPIASFLFLGPTGVGKTETAKTIAEVFFGSETDMVRLDMSQYQTPFSIADLIGSAEGSSPGLLTQSVRQHPYGVLLLDELEKANPDVRNIFLTILDEGYFTDGKGVRVDCKNLVIIATSNAAAEYIYEKLRSGQSVSDTAFTKELTHYLITQEIFSPEFLNRFDGVVAFQPLKDHAIEKVAQTFLKTIAKQIEEIHKVKITVSDKTLKTLMDEAYDPAFGARDMERVIRQNIEDRIAKMIFDGTAKPGDTISL